MIEIKTNCYKGTRILLGNKKRQLLNQLTQNLIERGFQEISIPVIQLASIFKNKVGEENQNLMFTFKDRGDRELCLAPEYTAVVQQLTKTDFSRNKDVKLFYVQECFRGEKPQRGRYRQFTQLGIEILNPKNPNQTLKECIELACSLMTIDYTLDTNVTRGLDYYQNGKGFEIRSKDLQIVGGGIYDGGVGFAIGIDRILLLDST